MKVSRRAQLDLDQGHFDPTDPEHMVYLQTLVLSGEVWRMPRSYQTLARRLVALGLLSPKERTNDQT